MSVPPRIPRERKLSPNGLIFLGSCLASAAIISVALVHIIARVFCS